MTKFTEAKRVRYLSLVATMNWIIILLCFFVIGIAVYMIRKVTEALKLLEDYTSKTLPGLLFGIGIMCIVFSGANIAIWTMSADPDKRKRMLSLMLVVHFLAFCACLACAAGAGFCYLHTSFMLPSSDDLVSAMSKYNEYGGVKREIDDMQIEYSCCGNDGFSDWFQLEWHEIIQKGNTTTTMDDVPFSCCDPKTLRPCIHRGVRYSDQHKDYMHNTSTTLYQDGCYAQLAEWLKVSYGGYAGVLLVSILLIQLMALLGGRRLQTSMARAEKLGRPTATTGGFIVSASRKTYDVESEEEEVGEEGGEEAEEHPDGPGSGEDTPSEIPLTPPGDGTDWPLPSAGGSDTQIQIPGMGDGSQPVPMIDDYPVDDDQPQQNIPNYPLSHEWQAFNNYYRQQPDFQQFPSPPQPQPPPPPSHVSDHWMFSGVPQFQSFYDKNTGYAPGMSPRLPAPQGYPDMARYPGTMADFPDRPPQQPMWGPPEQMYPGVVPPIVWGPFGMNPSGRDPYGMPPGPRDPYDMPPGRQYPYDMPPGRRDPYGIPPDRRDPYGIPPDRRDPYGMPSDHRYPYDRYPARRDPYASDDDDRRSGRRRSPRSRRDRPVEEETVYYSDTDDLREELRRLVDSDDSIRYDDGEDSEDTDTRRRRRRPNSSDTDDRYNGSGSGRSRGRLDRYSRRKDTSHHRYQRLF